MMLETNIASGGASLQVNINVNICTFLVNSIFNLFKIKIKIKIKINK